MGKLTQTKGGCGSLKVEKGQKTKKARRVSAGPKKCPTVNAVYRQFL